MNHSKPASPRHSDTPGQGKPNRINFQTLSLALLLGLPFGLHQALIAGNDVLATILFALIALAMAIVVWAG
ncbi:MAG: hypothetical protein U1B80_08405 [Anaerolineaceae bacterium]|nr:hypothetical protein [Anaerolineaceae bacterium]